MFCVGNKLLSRRFETIFEIPPTPTFPYPAPYCDNKMNCLKRHYEPHGDLRTLKQVVNL
jgi:hypothetical protein